MEAVCRPTRALRWPVRFLTRMAFAICRGYSVHDELEHLVEAGLTPAEALEAATRRAAAMLDADDEFGTIEPGKRADLLILGANPLDDIRNTRSLETVMAEGLVVDRDALPIRIP